MNFALVHFGDQLDYDENGNPNGIMYDHMNVLSEFVNFFPVLTKAQSFAEGTRMVDGHEARVDSICTKKHKMHKL